MGKRRGQHDPPKETQFKPGVSGNPGGRPGGMTISRWIKKLLEMEELPDPKTLTIAGQIALARIKKSLTDRGDVAAEFVADRSEGKVKQTVKVEGDGIGIRMTPEQKRQAAENVLKNLGTDV